MSLKTVLVRVLLTYADSTPAFNVKVDATLNGYELDSGVVVPAKVSGRTNLSGEALLSLWPNARGSGASSYRIEASHGRTLLDVVIVVPDTDDGLPIAIEDIINAAPFPALDASQQALVTVQAAVVAAGAQAQLAEASAEDAAAQAVIANAQRALAQTAKAGADTAQAGAQTAQAAAQASATTASQQAAIADQQRVLAQTAKAGADTALASATLQASTATDQAVIAAQQRALTDTAKAGADAAKTGADLSAAAAAVSAEVALGAFPGMVAVYIDTASNAMTLRTLFMNHVGTQP